MVAAVTEGYETGEVADEAEEICGRVREATMAAGVSVESGVERLAVCEAERAMEGEGADGLLVERETRTGLLVSLSRAGELVLRGMLKESRSRVEGRCDSARLLPFWL